MENSVEGAVPATLDEFSRWSPLVIAARDVPAGVIRPPGTPGTGPG